MELRPITPENYQAIVALQVLPEQRGFVASTTNSLVEAYVYPGAEAKALYDGDVLRLP